MNNRHGCRFLGSRAHHRLVPEAASQHPCPDQLLDYISSSSLNAPGSDFLEPSSRQPLVHVQAALMPLRSSEQEFVERVVTSGSGRLARVLGIMLIGSTDNATKGFLYEADN